MTHLYTISITCIALLTMGHCSQVKPTSTPANATHIHGITLEAPPTPIDSATYTSIQATTASNWVAIVPFGFCKKNEPTIYYNSKRQWWGEKDEGVLASIQLAHKQQLNTMLKPQLWIGGGTYTGHFTLPTQAAWLTWQQQYTSYILHYAAIAEQQHVAMLCIGTELDSAVAYSPTYWASLIQAVKQVYQGKLTYAANWNTYSHTSMWATLDYIGVDAYFPLTQAATPTVAELVQAWQPHKAALAQVSKQYSKPILFTEYGYRSIDGCAHQPWQSYNTGSINNTAQDNAYQALYRTFTSTNWYAGGFIWKWHANDNMYTTLNNDYTPQHKPVLQTIKQWHTLN